MKLLTLIAAGILLGFPGYVQAGNSGCSAMTKNLQKLRLEYKNYAASKTKDHPLNFDELTKILDKIVDLKHEMRKKNCEIPPRK